MRTRENLLSTYGFILVFFLYYATHAVFAAFGSPFMVDRGLTESAIGLVFASSAILAMVIQAISLKAYETWLDLGARRLLLIHIALATGMTMGLALFKGPLVTSVLFSMTWALCFSLVPIFSALYIEYKKMGLNLSFGRARAMGSLSYALTCLGLAKIFGQDMNGQVLLTLGLGVMVLIFLLGFFLKDPGPVVAREESATIEIKKTRGNFIWILLAIVLSFIMHNIVTSYLYQFMEPLGLGANQVGLALGISALVEIPMLFAYPRLEEAYGSRALLILSGIGFSLKPILILAFYSAPILYANQFIHIIGYPLYAGAIVAYTEKTMEGEEAARAQFDINIALTLGGVVGNVLGGYLIQYHGLKVTTIFGLVTSLLGLAFFVRGLGPYGKREPKMIQ